MTSGDRGRLTFPMAIKLNLDLLSSSSTTRQC